MITEYEFGCFLVKSFFYQKQNTPRLGVFLIEYWAILWSKSSPARGAVTYHRPYYSKVYYLQFLPSLPFTHCPSWHKQSSGSYAAPQSKISVQTSGGLNINALFVLMQVCGWHSEGSGMQSLSTLQIFFPSTSLPSSQSSCRSRIHFCFGSHQV